MVAREEMTLWGSSLRNSISRLPSTGSPAIASNLSGLSRGRASGSSSDEIHDFRRSAGWITPSASHAITWPRWATLFLPVSWSDIPNWVCDPRIQCRLAAIWLGRMDVHSHGRYSIMGKPKKISHAAERYSCANVQWLATATRPPWRTRSIT